MRTKKLLSLFLVLLGALPASLVRAESAPSPHYLLSDAEMTDASAMSLRQLHDFLSRRGTLGYYYAPDVDGVTRTATEIIYRVSQTYKISPKFLLALLQREQSIVEDTTPTAKQYDWAAGFGVCDSCKMDDPNLQAWKGFAQQIEGAARQIRNRYLPDLETKGTTISGIGPGKPKVIDGTVVTPANKATAVLYTYTPHLHGNSNFVKIWKRWFSLSHPDGSLVRVIGEKDVWVIRDGTRYRFATKSAFASRFEDKNVLPISAHDLDTYTEGTPIRFSNYSLVAAAGKTYLLDGDLKREIVSDAVFRNVGFNPDEVIEASEGDLLAYSDGPVITLESSHPRGALLQDKKTGGVYFVQDGMKHPIWAREILNVRFPKRPLSAASEEQLLSYPTGAPVRFPDGTLLGVKGSPTVYVLENGIRRPIMDEETFRRYGWKWQNVVWTTENVAILHGLGEPIQAKESTVEAAGNP